MDVVAERARFEELEAEFHDNEWRKEDWYFGYLMGVEEVERRLRERRIDLPPAAKEQR
jgi:hypothetical protein